MTTFQSFFLVSILVLFALTVAFLLYRVGCWAWRKMFDDPDDHYSL